MYRTVPYLESKLISQHFIVQLMQSIEDLFSIDVLLCEVRVLTNASIAVHHWINDTI